ncbi:MAG: hypothetical protein QF893_18950 [Alphaproteobacteria bacterium]|nr:hypothetical protein [Alphaproteobacteria bacterium]
MSHDIEKITSEVATHKDSQIAKIEDDITKERDGRREERFFWIFGAFILLDFLAFPSMSWAATFFLFVLQLIFLVLLGDRLGVDNVYVVTRNVVDQMKRIKPSKSDRED